MIVFNSVAQWRDFRRTRPLTAGYVPDEALLCPQDQLRPRLLGFKHKLLTEPVGAEQVQAKDLDTFGIWGLEEVLVPFGYPGLSPGALGFVPTMGALHDGHLELVRRSLRENSHTMVSIFVNPTQFDNPDDLKAYPSNMQADLDLLEPLGVDFVLAPSADQIYPEIGEGRELAPAGVLAGPAASILCGAHRPGHFNGMLTVVLKLLNLAQATRAYFGEKDYQQLKLVQGMVDDFFLEVEIVACPTEREPDGLARSSRNQRLDGEARQLAAKFPQILNSADSPQQAAEQLAAAGFQVDYVQDWQDRRLAAVSLPKVRLIDNIELRTKQ